MYSEREHLLLMTDAERKAIKWSDLDSEVRKALLRWFNCSKVTAADKRRLLKLWTDGRFWFWDCMLCNDPCVHAEPTKEEWGHFQGANDDIDWCFFGNPEVYTRRALMSMCNSCRCYKCADIPEGSPGEDMDDCDC
jgi:hypothetical protein